MRKKIVAVPVRIPTDPNRVVLNAYAKINLYLRVTGKRADGYHELETVMQRISFCDTLYITKTPFGIDFSCNSHMIPVNEDNLCYRAAALFFAATGIKGGIRIHLKKRVFARAGLGGGSTDAATVLKGMAGLYNVPEKEMFPLAEKLGADVPFCLAGGTAMCRGIGEKMEPLSFPGMEKFSVTVSQNCAGCSTPEVFSRFDTLPPPEKVDAHSILEGLSTGDFDRLARGLHNDLTPAALGLRPEIGELTETVREAGGVPLMSGSGSAVFGLFPDRESGVKARNFLRRKKKIATTLCSFLDF